jgi:hypothetical protein
LLKVTEMVNGDTTIQTQFLLVWKSAKHLTALVYTSRPSNRKSHEREPVHY